MNGAKLTCRRRVPAHRPDKTNNLQSAISFELARSRSARGREQEAACERKPTALLKRLRVAIYPPRSLAARKCSESVAGKVSQTHVPARDVLVIRLRPASVPRTKAEIERVRPSNKFCHVPERRFYSPRSGSGRSEERPDYVG